MQFYKYESAGNDFILCEEYQLTKNKIKKLCDRHYGVGADGILLLSHIKNGRCELKIYNADGSKAKMCGNGLKIVAYHLSKIFIHQMHFLISVNDKEYLAYHSFDKVRVRFPMAKCVRKEKDYVIYDVGNIHYLFNQPLNDEIQREIANNFAHQNITFYQLHDEHIVEIRTYERGVGFTLSCGSASIALASEVFLENPSLNALTIKSKGGIYQIKKQKDYLLLEGKVHLIMKGDIEKCFFDKTSH